MMLISFVLVGLTLLGSDRPPCLEVNSYAFGIRYSVTVTPNMFEAAPVWKVEAENPSLPARKAMLLALATRMRLVQDTADWKWEQESAALIEAAPNVWYWLVTFEARTRQGGGTGPAPTIRVVVLMDGTVVEPKVTKDKD